MELGFARIKELKIICNSSINETFNDATVNTIGIGERRFNVLSTVENDQIFDEQVFTTRASNPCIWLATQMPRQPHRSPWDG